MNYPMVLVRDTDVRAAAEQAASDTHPRKWVWALVGCSKDRNRAIRQCRVMDLQVLWFLPTWEVLATRKDTHHNQVVRMVNLVMAQQQMSTVRERAWAIGKDARHIRWMEGELGTAAKRVEAWLLR